MIGLGLSIPEVAVRGGAGGVAPAAPTLAITSGISDNLPDFSLTGDVINGDTIRIQYSTDPAFPDSNFVTGVVASGNVNFAVSSFTDLSWYFRARTERLALAPSDWSGTVSEGIFALPSFMLVGLPFRPVLPFPTATTRASELAVGIGLCGSVS